MPNVKRGEVWQIDFGLAAKVRPALVLGCDIADEDRVLVAAVYHTTALRGSRYEAPLRVQGSRITLLPDAPNSSAMRFCVRAGFVHTHMVPFRLNL